MKAMESTEISSKNRKLLSILGGIGAFFMASYVSYLILYILALKFGNVEQFRPALPETTIKTIALSIGSFCGGIAADLAIPGAFKRMSAGVLVLAIVVIPLTIPGFALNYLYTIDHA